jgi:hypothetical protein
MLIKGSARGTLADTLPNLRLVVRDKPHSARRLLQRTLPKDAFINKLMTTLLWSRGSLARLVQHSPQFQEKFKHHQRRHSPAGKPVKDLSYAKQRFDSTARPLGRMVVHFEALLQTAMDIVRERGPSTKEHQSANRALELLDTEAMLQLGMVADACEAVVRFIRFLDKECFEISALPAHIDTLAATATELFHNGGCLKHAGYTLQMLESIKHPRLVVMSGGQPKTLGEAGGPTSLHAVWGVWSTGGGWRKRSSQPNFQLGISSCHSTRSTSPAIIWWSTPRPASSSNGSRKVLPSTRTICCRSTKT